MRLRIKEALGDFCLALGVFALMYVASEVGYRAYRYATLSAELVSLAQKHTLAPKHTAGQTGAQAFMFDPYVGFRYTPNIEIRRGPPFNNTFSTNSHGHVSPFEYPKKKPSGEYRIAVIGDSFTAGTGVTVRWTELLEEQLNASLAWKDFVGQKSTRVINFGVDGTGMLQFAGMTCHHAMGFEPDLVIINFLSDDFLRTMRYKNEDASADLKSYVKVNYLDKIDWLRLYPEYFAATIGRAWNMKTHLPTDATVLMALDFRYERREDAIKASAAAVRDIMRCAPNALFLYNPTFEEFLGQIPEMWRGLIDDFLEMVPEWSFVSMQPRLEALLDGKQLADRPDLRGLSMLQITALPNERWPELYRWFFLPDDHHWSTYGTVRYGHEVAKLLIERATAANLGSRASASTASQ